MVINSGFSILDLCGRLILIHFGGIQFPFCLLFRSLFSVRLLGLVNLELCQGVANFPVISHSRFPSFLNLLLLLFLLFLLLHLLACWWEPLAHSTLAYDAPTSISLTFSQAISYDDGDANFFLRLSSKRDMCTQWDGPSMCLRDLAFWISDSIIPVWMFPQKVKLRAGKGWKWKGGLARAPINLSVRLCSILWSQSRQLDPNCKNTTFQPDWT